jgi:DNA-binding MarR family transcriptional regulator
LHGHASLLRRESFLFQALGPNPGQCSQNVARGLRAGDGTFRNLMSAYIHAFLEQVLVSAACNGAHSLKERLARWLLMMRDRSDGDTLPITQGLLAEMQGVQRPTVTNSARELEDAGLIERGRRQVTILDRQGLSEESCECYQLVRTRLAFHLPKTYA